MMQYISDGSFSANVVISKLKRLEKLETKLSLRTITNFNFKNIIPNIESTMNNHDDTNVIDSDSDSDDDANVNM